MTDRNDIEQPVAALRTWVEPEIATLAIEETAGLPTVGFDGGPKADCTKS